MANKYNYKLYWDRKREETAAIRKRGLVYIRLLGNHIHVICPYDAGFNREARVLCGRWRERSKVWTFPREIKPLVIALCEKYWPGKVGGI